MWRFQGQSQSSDDGRSGCFHQYWLTLHLLLLLLLTDLVLYSQFPSKSFGEIFTFTSFDVNFTPNFTIREILVAQTTIAGGRASILGLYPVRVGEMTQFQMRLIRVSPRKASMRVTLVSQIVFVYVNAVFIERTLVCLFRRVFLQMSGEVSSDFKYGIAVRTFVRLFAIE